MWSVTATAIVGIAGILATIYAAKLAASATLAQVAAESERQAAQHAEDHRRNRQTTYHLFLTAAAQLRAMGHAAVSDSDEANKARWEFTHLLHGLELFGTEEVRQAAVAVTDALERVARGGRVEVFEQPPGYVGEEGRRQLEALLAALRDRDVAARMDDLLEAMRGDVAPGRWKASGKQR